MTGKLELECSHDDYHAIHVAADKGRADAKVVKVPKAALRALLRDHTKLIQAHRQGIGGIT